MPIPKPGENESQNDFVSRCMSFLDGEDSSLSQEQRVAACHEAYRRAKKEDEEPEEATDLGDPFPLSDPNTSYHRSGRPDSFIAGQYPEFEEDLKKP